MSIKIHHGPPGSYKTSGAVMDDFQRWAKEGRTIITNVRGLTQDQLDRARPDWECNLISIDTETKEGRDKLGRWYQWAPFGAFLLIDEAQRIFPKIWREKDLLRLDQAYEPWNDDRGSEAPEGWFDAWDRHRHFGWDLVLTTPNLKKIRDDILGASEMCYAHKNLAVLGNIPGFKGAYMELQHSADSTARQSITARRKKITKETWGLYESTSTGEIRDTAAGQSIFKNPRLALVGLIGLVAIFSAIRAVGSGEGNFVNAHLLAPTVVEKEPPPAPQPPKDRPPDRDLPRDSLVDQSRPVDAPDVAPLNGQQVDIVAGIKREKDDFWFYLFGVSKDDVWYRLESTQLLAMGYTIQPMGPCAVVLKWQDQQRTVTCGDRSQERGLGV